MVLRNFLNTLRSHKTASILNIVGLAIAFTAFYVMASQVWYSISFNRPLPDSDRIYLVSPDWNAGGEGGSQWAENSPQPATRDALSRFPDGEMYTWYRSFSWPDYVWGKTDNGEYIKYRIGLYNMGTDGIEMFGFRQIEGDLSKMSEPNTVIISRSASERLGCSTGDEIYVNGGQYYNDMNSKKMLTVAGIFEDFPQNTFLYNHHIFLDDHCKDGQENNSWNYSAFVKLKKGADLDEFVGIWEEVYEEWYMGMVEEWKDIFGEDDYVEGDEKQPMKLIPLDKMYFEPDFAGTYYQNGSAKGTATIAAIAMLIIIVAFINFFNFYMALVPVRIRNVNINKVLGATQKQLRARLLGEAILLTLMAFLLSGILSVAISNTIIKGAVTCSLALKDNLGIICVICILMIVIACASALFPAIYKTNANTSMAVKTGFAQSRSGRFFRSVLVGLQFTVSMALVIITAVFFLQYRYMVTYDVGFDKENILTFTCQDLMEKSETVIDRLGQHPDVIAVTAAASDILFNHNIWGRENNGKNIQLHAYGVRHNFPEVMGIDVLEGEGFTRNGGKEIMFTQSTVPQLLEIYPDGTFDDFEVKGTIGDLRLTSVSKGDVATCLYTDDRIAMQTYFLRIMPDADVKNIMSHINGIVTELEPRAGDQDIRFMDKDMTAFYGNTLRESIIIGLFALIAVVISLMGVFSIVMFETRHRESEISIRKVYGASVEEIIRMFNRRYVIIVSICFCIATPVAWVIGSRWLEQFAHRITVPLWAFPAALAATLAITMAVVSLRSLRAARTNPAVALKKE